MLQTAEHGSTRRERHEARLREQEVEFDSTLKRLRSLAEQRRQLDESLRAAKEELEREIRLARKAKVNYRLICDAVGLSHQRISQIVTSEAEGT